MEQDAEQDVRRIDASDLADLQQMAMRHSRALAELGALYADRKAIEAAEAEKLVEIDTVNRERTFHHNRVLRKYNLPENTRIGETGEIVTP